MSAITPTRAAHKTHRFIARVPYLALALAAMAAGVALYVATMAPTVLWGDDAELQRIVVTGEPRVIGQSSGASHLLWLVLASAFVRSTSWLPLDPAGRTTLLTALFGAVALGFVALAGCALASSVARRPVVAGVAAAAAFALSHTFWLLAVRPDVYTLQTALLAAALWSVLRWRQASGRWAVGSGRRLVTGGAGTGAVPAPVADGEWCRGAVSAPAVPAIERPALSAQRSAPSTRQWASSLPPVVFLLAAGGAIAAALANHAMILASLPALAALALAAPDLRRALQVGAAVAVPAVLALLVATFQPAVLSPQPSTLSPVVAPLGEMIHTLHNFRPVVPGLRDLVPVPFFLVYQFPLSLPLAVPGAVALWRRDRGALIGLALLQAGNVALPLLVQLHDRFQFFLPSYLPIALVTGVGVAVLWDGAPFGRLWEGSTKDEARTGRMGIRASSFVFRRSTCRATRWAVALALLAPLALYPIAAAAGGALAARLAPARTLPGRDPVAFYLWPSKFGYDGARRYGEAALAGMAPQAAIVADWLPYETLRYLQTVEGRRPDVLLANINAGGGAQLRFLIEQDGRRPLYLADNAPFPYYEVPEIERCFAVQREGVVYRVSRRQEASSNCG